MGSPVEKYPEFFRYYDHDHCSDYLRIPDAFLEYLTEKIPEKAILRNRLGDRWPIKVAKTMDGLFFQEGWSQLVSDFSLQGGEFMVFKYDGQSEFDILILETNGSMKQKVGYSGRTKPASQEGEKTPTEEEEDKEDEAGMDHVEDSAKRGNCGGRGENYSFSGYHVKNLEKGIVEFLPSNNPFFVTRIRHDGRNELNIPYDSWADSGMKFRKRIEIQDPQGRLMTGKLVVWKYRRHVVTNFWKQIRKLNKVTKDDIVICELKATNTNICRVIKVQIIHPDTIKCQSKTK